MVQKQLANAIAAGVVILSTALGAGAAIAAPQQATVTHASEAGCPGCGPDSGGTDW